jgi:RNA-directed DNA polymerase
VGSGSVDAWVTDWVVVPLIGGQPNTPVGKDIYLNEVDWAFDAIRRQTAQGSYEAVNYHRFSDDIVITVSGHWTKRGWAQRAMERLQEELAPLGVRINRDKTRIVNTLKGEAFTFLGFDFRRVPKKREDGHFIRMTQKKKSPKSG